MRVSRSSLNRPVIPLHRPKGGGTRFSSRRQDDLHVGLLFFQLEGDPEVAQFLGNSGIKLELRRIRSKPSYSDLAQALGHAKHAYSVGPWLGDLDYELVLRDLPSTPGSLAYGDAAEQFLNFLAVAADASLVCTPFSLTSSWSEVASSDSVRAVELSYGFSPPLRLPWSDHTVHHNSRISQGSMDRVREWLVRPPPSLSDMVVSGAVKLALRCLRTYFYDPDDRAQVARLWIGIEALASTAPPKKKTSSEIASLAAKALKLTCSDRSRDDCRVYVRSLQKRRNQAVHGAIVERREMADIVPETAHLLRSMLSAFMDNQLTLSSEDARDPSEGASGEGDG